MDVIQVDELGRLHCPACDGRSFDLRLSRTERLGISPSVLRRYRRARCIQCGHDVRAGEAGRVIDLR